MLLRKQAQCICAAAAAVQEDKLEADRLPTPAPPVDISYAFRLRRIPKDLAMVEVATNDILSVCTWRVPFEDNYQVCLEKLEAAGIEAIVAETQRQVDAWLTSRSG
jgi:hypothetical protein